MRIAPIKMMVPFRNYTPITTDTRPKDKALFKLYNSQPLKGDRFEKKNVR